MTLSFALALLSLLGNLVMIGWSVWQARAETRKQEWSLGNYTFEDMPKTID